MVHLHDGADRDAARVRIVGDLARVLRKRLPRCRHQRPLEVVLAGLHDPVDELLRLGKARIARLVERRHPLDRVEDVWLEPAHLRHRGAMGVEPAREERRAELRNELLHRVEEADAELLEQRIGRGREVFPRRRMRDDHLARALVRAREREGRRGVRRVSRGGFRLGRGRDPDRVARLAERRAELDRDGRLPHALEVHRDVGPDLLGQRVVDEHADVRSRVHPRARLGSRARDARLGRTGLLGRTGAGHEDTEEPGGTEEAAERHTGSVL